MVDFDRLSSQLLAELQQLRNQRLKNLQEQLSNKDEMEVVNDMIADAMNTLQIAYVLINAASSKPEEKFVPFVPKGDDRG